MALNVIYRNLDLNSKERARIEERAQRKLAKVARFLNGDTDASLTLYRERHRFRGEMRVTAAGEQLYRVEVEGQGWSRVVDTAMNKLARTLRRHKDRTSSHHRAAPAGLPASGFGQVSAEELIAELEEEFDLWTEEVLKKTG